MKETSALAKESEILSNSSKQILGKVFSEYRRGARNVRDVLGAINDQVSISKHLAEHKLEFQLTKSQYLSMKQK